MHLLNDRLKFFILKNYRQLMFGLVFFIVLLIYYFSMPKTIALEDDGLFILSAVFNGVSHPPGYPLHSIISHLITYIPFGSMAVKVHMVSAFFGAATSILAGIICFNIYRDLSLGISTAFIVAFGHGFWSQSIVAEIYTFNAFLVLLFIYFSLNLRKLLDENDSINKVAVNKNVLYLSLILGLGISNHWPLFILGGLGCGLLLVPTLKYKGVVWNKAFIGLLLGLLPIVWLVVNSNREPFINFIGALTNFEEVYDFLRRKIYTQDINSSASASVVDKISYVLYSVKTALSEHFLIGSAFVLLGLFLSPKKNNYKILIVCFFSTPILLPLLLNYDYLDENKMFYKPFYLVPYTLSGMFLSIGIFYVSNKFKLRKTMVAMLTGSVVVYSVYISGGDNFRDDYDWSLDYALSILNSLEKNSVIFVDSDMETASLSYARYVQHYRTDIDIIHRQGLVLGTRLFDSRYVKSAQRENKVIEFVKKSKRPVYFTYQQNGVGLENYWLYYKYNKKIKNGMHTLKDVSNNSDFLIRVFTKSKDMDDSWTYFENQKLKNKAIPSLFFKIVKSNNYDIRNAYKKFVISTFDDMNGLLISIDMMKQLSLLNMFGGELNVNKIAKKLFIKENSKIKRAIYLNYKAESELSKGNINRSLIFFEKSAVEWNSPKNYAIKERKKLCEKYYSPHNKPLCNNI